jgi:hypothetical protein
MGETLLLSWMDKEPLNMISTMHSEDMNDVAVKFGRRKMKPECVTDYNAFIQGADNADQYLALYPFMRKTVKWPKTAFFTSCSAHRSTHFGYLKKQTQKRDWNTKTS